MGVQNLPFRGKSLTWFVVRLPELQMYANFQFDRSTASIVYDTDVTQCVHVTGDAATSMALRKGENVVVFVGNTTERTITTAVSIDLALTGSYSLKAFNSLRGEWVDQAVVSSAQIKRGMAIQLDRKGFCVFELRQEV
jgi:hypothetical protein